VQKEVVGAALPEGTVIAGYTISRLLDAGGFGLVYLAHHEDDPSDVVAIKEFLPERLAMREAGMTVQPLSEDSEHAYRVTRRKFIEEAAMLLDLGASGDTKNIVRVRAFFERNNTAYMAMEYLTGRSLKALISEPKELISISQSKAILKDLLHSLKHVHTRNIWHRDIKPDNIMFRGDTGIPVLIDFGAARQDTGNRAKTQLGLLTPLYAAPEQWPVATGSDNPIGPWTDIYSLAATFYHVLSGVPPCSADERTRPGQNDRHIPLIERIDIAADDDAFIRSIDKAMQLVPTDRFQSVGIWLAAIDVQSDVLQKDASTATTQARFVDPTVALQTDPIDNPAHYTTARKLLFWGMGAALFAGLLAGALHIIPNSSGGLTRSTAVSIEKLASQLECAHVESTSGDSYHGYVGSQASLDLLRVAAKQSGTSVAEIQLINEGKLCRALDDLRDVGLPLQFTGPDTPVAVSSTKKTYRDGDAMEFTVTNNTSEPRYLLVDYFDSAATRVVHLSPGVEAQQRLNPGESVTFGKNSLYTAGEPFGENLLIATLSAVDPYATSGAPPTIQPLTEYLDVLRPLRLRGKNMPGTQSAEQSHFLIFSTIAN